MEAPREQLCVGLDYLAAASTLLQRIRAGHPTAGLYEAADLQWWWAQRPRPTDSMPQLVWFDRPGRPEAAVVITGWGSDAHLDPIVLPGADRAWVAHVVDRGLAHAAEHGIESITLEVDVADGILRDVMLDRGFTVEGDGVVETSLALAARPEVAPLPAGYRSTDRRSTPQRPHHMISEVRGHPDPEARLRQTSLYRPDLDLVVFVDDDDAVGDTVAAYGLCWYDPHTRTGLVEPMRTEDAHQGRGLARHVLTLGLDRLAAAGAHRVKICYEPDNPASERLYLGVGFEPYRRTVVLARRPSTAVDPSVRSGGEHS